MVFLDENGYRRNNYESWHNHNDLYRLKQFSDKPIIFTIGNPDLFIKTNNFFTAVDSFNYYQLTPLNIWKHKQKGDLSSFIKHFNISYFYFKAGVNVPECISHNAEVIIESKITKSMFIILKQNKYSH